MHGITYLFIEYYNIYSLYNVLYWTDSYKLYVLVNKCICVGVCGCIHVCVWHKIVCVEQLLSPYK